jgi:hypothetical protein
MMWRVGQELQYQRPNHRLTHCFVVSSDNGSVIISCPNERTVVCGRQHELEKSGWALRTFQPCTK